MVFIFTAVSALVPSLLFLWYFHAKDAHREPGKVIWATFGLGVAIVVPVLLVDGLIYLLLPDLGHTIYPKGLTEAFLLAAIPEEFFKFLVLYYYASRHKEFDEPMDGIVYGVVASLGFATLENVLYTAGGGLGVAVLRSVTAIPCHAFLGAIMGYYIGQMRFGPPALRKKHMTLALLLPMLLHGMYDFPILTIKQMSEVLGKDTHMGQAIGLVGVTLSVLIFMWVWGVKLAKRLRREQEAEMARAKPERVVEHVQGKAMEPQRAGGGFWAWAGLIGGGILASVGGLVTLGIVLGLAFGETSSEELGPVLMGGAIIGLVPLGLGIWFFALGLRSVRRKNAAKAAVV